MAIRATNTSVNSFILVVSRGKGPANTFTATLGAAGSSSASATIPFSLEECNRDSTFRAVTTGASPRVSITEVAESNAIGGAVDAISGALAGGVGTAFLIKADMTSGGTAGTADAVNLLSQVPGAALPFNIEVIDTVLAVSTAVGGSTVQLHNTASGAGSTTYSTAMSSAATGKVRDASTTMAQIAAGGTLFARRSDRSMVGEIAVLCVRTS